MTPEKEYYHVLNEIRNGKHIDPYNSYRDLDQEDYDKYKASLFTGCAVALLMTAALFSSIWYVCRVIFD